MELAVFIVFAVLGVVSSLVVVAHRNPVYSVMSLVVTLISTAGLFVLLGAPFLAALQVLVYAGAILVLFLFVLMLLNLGREQTEVTGHRGQRWGALISAAVFGLLLAVLFAQTYLGRSAPPLTEETVALRPLARILFSTYLLPFELVGLLLLAAIIAATVLARRPEREIGRRDR